MNPDPEVQALLEEGIQLNLPTKLLEAGWDRSMRDMGYLTRRLKTIEPTPVDQQAPTFDERCVQCGLGLAKDAQGYYRDRIGRTHCDRALMPDDLRDKVQTTHVVEGANEDTTAYIEALRAHFDRQARAELERQAIRARRGQRPSARHTGQCDATNHNHGHVHYCSEHLGHFGFHVCIACRHLWR